MHKNDITCIHIYIHICKLDRFPTAVHRMTLWVALPVQQRCATDWELDVSKA